MSENRRYFTVESANSSLPLVGRIVDDLLRLHPIWRQAVSAYELAQDDEPSADVESPVARAAREKAGMLAGEIESCLDELEQIGCLFRGFEMGLIDFPTQIDGRVVVLCWQRGEESVTHWHELDSGYAGRQPIEKSSVPQEAS